jgi:hypothetical protein
MIRLDIYMEKDITISQASFDSPFTGLCSQTAQYKEAEVGQWCPSEYVISLTCGPRPYQSWLYVYKMTHPTVEPEIGPQTIDLSMEMFCKCDYEVVHNFQKWTKKS